MWALGSHLGFNLFDGKQKAPNIVLCQQPVSIHSLCAHSTLHTVHTHVVLRQQPEGVPQATPQALRSGGDIGARVHELEAPAPAAIAATIVAAAIVALEAERRDLRSVVVRQAPLQRDAALRSEEGGWSRGREWGGGEGSAASTWDYGISRGAVLLPYRCRTSPSPPPLKHINPDLSNAGPSGSIDP